MSDAQESIPEFPLGRAVIQVAADRAGIDADIESIRQGLTDLGAHAKETLGRALDEIVAEFKGKLADAVEEAQSKLAETQSRQGDEGASLLRSPERDLPIEAEAALPKGMMPAVEPPAIKVELDGASIEALHEVRDSIQVLVSLLSQKGS